MGDSMRQVFKELMQAMILMAAAAAVAASIVLLFETKFPIHLMDGNPIHRIYFH